MANDDISKFITVQPESVIIFTSNPYQTVGQIKISFQKSTDLKKSTQLKKDEKQNNYWFSLQTDNKQYYKVSKAKGQINQNPFIITIFLINLKQIEKRLKDSFKLTISKDEKDLNIYRFRISIEEIKDISLDNGKNNLSDNSQKNDTVFTNPSVYLQSYYTSKVSTSRIIRKSISRVGKSQDKQNHNKKNVEEQILKQNINFFSKQLKDKKRKIEELVYEQQKFKAANRFRIYTTLVLFVIFFLMGLFVGKLGLNFKSIFIKQQKPKSFWDW